MNWLFKWIAALAIILFGGFAAAQDAAPEAAPAAAESGLIASAMADFFELGFDKSGLEERGWVVNITPMPNGTKQASVSANYFGIVVHAVIAEDGTFTLTEPLLCHDASASWECLGQPAVEYAATPIPVPENIADAEVTAESTAMRDRMIDAALAAINAAAPDRATFAELKAEIGRVCHLTRHTRVQVTDGTVEDLQSEDDSVGNASQFGCLFDGQKDEDGNLIEVPWVVVTIYDEAQPWGPRGEPAVGTIAIGTDLDTGLGAGAKDYWDFGPGGNIVGEIHNRIDPSSIPSF